MSRIPEGFHTVTPGLVVSDTRKAMALYEKAFGAVPGEMMEMEDGKIIHASFNIGNSKLFINDDMPFMIRHPQQGNQSTGFFLYVEDCDAAYKQALDAGMENVFEPADQFWGDRTGTVKDEFGYVWTIAHQAEQLTAEQIAERRAAAGF